MAEEETGYPLDPDADEGTGLFCFAHSLRMCGPECMAYISHPRSARSQELNTQQKHCMVLLSAERLSRGATIIASTLGDMMRKSETAAADAERKENTPQPSGPFGAPVSPPGSKP